MFEGAAWNTPPGRTCCLRQRSGTACTYEQVLDLLTSCGLLHEQAVRTARCVCKGEAAEFCASWGMDGPSALLKARKIGLDLQVF